MGREQTNKRSGANKRIESKRTPAQFVLQRRQIDRKNVLALRPERGAEDRPRAALDEAHELRVQHVRAALHLTQLIPRRVFRLPLLDRVRKLILTPCVGVGGAGRWIRIGRLQIEWEVGRNCRAKDPPLHM